VKENLQIIWLQLFRDKATMFVRDKCTSCPGNKT
jgi:hypothetical protein